MNRIEEKMALLQSRKEKALITYMTAGLPDMNGTKALIHAQEEAGVDVIELGIPFSDPVADGSVIQNASYRSICQGTNLENVFRLMKEIRLGGVETPIIFMMYYNTILHCGVRQFAEKCAAAGVDGVIVPDLPFEEQRELQDALDEEGATILIQLVSPVSKERIPMILEHARGFVYCVSSMGVTGQAGTFHRDVHEYLTEVKRIADVPIMMGFGIRAPEDLAVVKDVIDGAIVGTHLMQILEESGYSALAAKEYCSQFKRNL